MIMLFLIMSPLFFYCRQLLKYMSDFGYNKLSGDIEYGDKVYRIYINEKKSKGVVWSEKITL